MNTLEFYQQQLNQQAAILPGVTIAKIAQARRAAMQRAVEIGWPTHKQESWKYTRSHVFEQQVFNAAITGQSSASEKIKSYLWPDCFHAVFYQGQFQEKLSVLPHDIKVVSLAQQPQTTELQMQSAFALLNDALWQDGLLIEIDENKKLEKPLQILLVEDGKATANFLKFILRAAAKSGINIIVHAINLSNEAHFSNLHLDTHLAAHAKVNLLKIHNAKTSLHFVNHQVQQATSSYLGVGELSLSNAWLRNELYVALEEQHALCHVFGFYLAKAREHLDHHLTVHHQVAHGTSKQFFKGIATDQAKAIFNGKVYVAPNAQKTDAEQHNQCLLLSSTAEIDTKPELEIYANDVKCAHGAAVGQLPEELLFYLMARGITEVEAKKMLMQAFAHEVFEKINWLPNALLLQLIDERLSCLS